MTDPLRSEYQRKSGRNNLSSWIEVKTGGSTGMPVAVIHDAVYRDRGRAGRLYSQYLCGFPFGTPYFRLWGSMQDIHAARDSAASRIASYLSGQLLLNAFHMQDQDIEKYIDMINASSTEYMMAYVDAAYQMAKYSLRMGKPIRPLRSIMACAGTVTSDMRETMARVFRAMVHNKYGSRECAEMACECERGRLHIYSNNVRLEIVTANGDPLPPGESGRVLVTLLSNTSFPMIRYDIGDIGTISRVPCSCGRPFPVLERLEGRSVEFLMTNEGGHVSPAYIIHLIGVVHNPGWIRRFQVVQTTVTDYELRLEVEQGVSESLYLETVSKIQQDLMAVLGQKSNITVSKMADIPLAASGKFFYTISQIRK
jgi:phenylacetate-CoA ligase